jgi:type I restriction enzyme S subunit
VPQDPNDEPARDFVKRIEAVRNEKTGSKKSRAAASHKPTYEIEPPFDIPESWQWVRLESLCEIISKGTTPAGGNKAYLPHGITYIRAENITSDGQLRIGNTKYISEQQHFSELSRSILKNGDLLITIAGSLGRSAIVHSEALPANTNQAVAFARPIDIRLSPFLLNAVMATSIQSLLLSQKKVTGVPNLTLEIISNLPVPLPPLAEQKRIVAKIEELRAMTSALAT